ncbi:MAG: ABC transporter ATP-binding protein [Methanoregula sp.]|jgi:iron complex transport system ATP-binding protein
MRLNISNLAVAYDKTPIIKSISFSAAAGEVVGIIGPNGCGKSTLIKTLAGINVPSEGTVCLDNLDLFTLPKIDMAKRVGYVPQDFRQMASITVLDTVTIGRRPHVSWALSKKDFEIINDAMKSMAILPLAGKRLDELSGGERQKVFIARALAQQPTLYLFDEPTSALDIRHQISVFRLIRSLAHAGGATVLVVVHDLNFAQYFADRIVLLKDGKIVAEGPPVEVMTRDRLRFMYGVEMCSIITDNGTYLLPEWEAGSDETIMEG